MNTLFILQAQATGQAAGQGAGAGFWVMILLLFGVMYFFIKSRSAKNFGVARPCSLMGAS